MWIDDVSFLIIIMCPGMYVCVCVFKEPQHRKECPSDSIIYFIIVFICR